MKCLSLVLQEQRQAGNESEHADKELARCRRNVEHNERAAVSPNACAAPVEQTRSKLPVELRGPGSSCAGRVGEGSDHVPASFSKTRVINRFFCTVTHSFGRERWSSKAQS